ncbi:hypothetical protein DU478_20435 [Thalassococcus profundi]|uniref:Calcium-binding protein n=1 Tax=Thalassococcus profundi TaxID=2282382 RepID=A0A369TGH8_9RHOB|nr:calcium-binding protein [Thalassococcus profundi]RDD64368.1 hypothetical protein DU478_20435 [Thalassococcus profundi]
MPTGIRHIGTTTAAGFDLPIAAISMTRVMQETATRIAMADYAYGATLETDLGPGGLPPMLATDWHSPGTRLALAVSGHSGASLPRAVIDTARAARDAGEGGGQRAYLGPGAHQDEAATVLATRVGGQEQLFVAAMDGAGLTGFAIGAGGVPGGPRARVDTARHYLDAVTDLAAVETPGGTYLYAASAREHGISGFRVGADARLDPVEDLGRAESLPVQTVMALETAQLAGRSFVIAAAAGSDSLTVLRVADDGRLSVADHLLDDRHTRFAGAAELEVVTVGDQVFVLAAGRDDGISLFALTPLGRLVHLDTLPDSLAAALDGVSGIAAQPVTGGFEFVTTAAGEAGLSLFRVDFDAPGTVSMRNSGAVNGTGDDDMLALGGVAGTIVAGGGDDILSDGAGADRLTGGAGADIFVLQADGARDVITDIRPGQDRLDLSQWAFLYDLGQIDLASASWGAVLRYGDEELELRSFDGARLDAADLAALVPELPGRFAVEIAPLREADAPADPDPFPDTVPGPDPLAPPAPEPAPRPAPAPIPAPTPAPAPVAGQTLLGGAGADSLSGGDGDDKIDGAGGNDTLRGGAGDDGIKGRAGHDLIYGGAGDDRLPGEAGNDRIFGGDGNDRLGGGLGHDLMVGGEGNDRGGGGEGNDTLRGEAGNDVFSGGAGTDALEGGDGDDRLAGSWGHDTVSGDAGNDTMGGGAGNDFMRGGDGDDVIGAGDMNDTVRGGRGDDFLGGGEGDDYLRGNEDNDTLNGGYGNDTLSGGTGSDVFVFNALSGGGRGLVTDFEDGTDLLRLVGRRLPGNDPLSKLGIADVRLGGEDAAQIVYGDHTILLPGVSAADLSTDDFLFL